MENGNYWSETPGHTTSRGGVQEPDLSDPPAIGRYRVIRRLGQGGFGRVYLARDDDLDRSVAIKVPNPERIAGTLDIETYLAEARALAKLDHPHIVPVYDVGRTEAGLCFVVSKYVDGSDLAERVRQGRPSLRESAELVAVVAEALHHAHTRGLVHRDVKPANILIDAIKEPWVADFGLALKDEDYGKGARLAGTPSYMSPEQARGEGHRVDGRSDIFSLGVVLYELLTGRKPFRGDTRTEVMDQIATAEPRPLRQIDDTIPRELERICQKALAKRASERYSTGRDMAEDLRLFLQTDAATPPTAPSPSPSTTAVPSAVSPPPISTHEATPVSAAPVRSDSDGRAVKIVPKGLRSFDRHDASFFLELLPGPRDREGLPESLRFWKTRIESTDPDATFKVGLIYGPSGCGKSSLVKAGLLPRLRNDVLAVYVEATPEETEARLLRNIGKVCPELGTGLDLVDSLAALRRGRVLRPGQKVLLVLDQFEQWLFARRTERDPELVAALRQCDGDHVQAVVMVRDDFWMAATRFMRDLEVRIVEGENSAAVDLFDLMHARRVLTAYGRAYGVLPEKTSELTPDQRAFLEQSVAGLAHEGKVISVRLALFAEMVKGKPWTTATLRDVGGTRGIGVTFLEETFSATTAPPEHRLHQRAAQAVLKALLPGTGADIKGQMRSEAELRDASGYAARPRDFEDVIAILDRELRLITPTDPFGVAGDEWRVAGENSGHDPTTRDRAIPPSTLHAPPSTRYYQLTHDYLVPSLREWLTRKQRESRRGRAELRLAERAAIWESRPETRHLPSVFEWLSIRTLSRPKDWTEPQRKMMRQAGRAHGLRAVAAAVGIVGLIVAGLDVWSRVATARRAALADKQATAKERVQRLLTADTADVGDLISGISGNTWAEIELKRAFKDPAVTDKARFHASVALLPTDPNQAAYLEDRIPRALPDELKVLGDYLRSRRTELTPKLWPELQSAKPGDARILPLAGALALCDPDNAHWSSQGGKVAQALVTTTPTAGDSWLKLLDPVKRHLAGPLAAIFRARDRPETERDLATRSLVAYAGDEPATLADLLMDADPNGFERLFQVVKEHASEVYPVFKAELQREPKREDRPPDPSWTKPDDKFDRAIRSAGGILNDRFAFCQQMPLAEFESVAEGLRTSRYRPVRFRPYADGSSVKVAAVWRRDPRNWLMAWDRSPEEIRRQNEKNHADKLIPVDVAGYIAMGAEGKPVDRYAALWVEASGEDDAQMYAGVTEDQEGGIQDKLKDQELIPQTIHLLHAPDDRIKVSSVWGSQRPGAGTARADRDLLETAFAMLRTKRTDEVIVDVAVSEASPQRTWRERVRAVRDLAEETLRRKPGNLDAMRSRARANLRLGEQAKALDDLNFLIGAGRDDGETLLDRAIARARLGRKPGAREDLASVQRSYLPDHSKLAAAAIMAAALGDKIDPSIQALEKAIADDPKDPELRFDAARAFAAASKVMAPRAIQIMKEATKGRDVDFGRIDDDPAFDPIRDDPEFLNLMKVGNPGRRYAAVWSVEENSEGTVIEGCGSTEQLDRARELIKGGYYPVAWSVAPTSEGPPATASVWHRPVVSEQQKDQLAERQARAAVALLRLGKGDEVWKHLRHSPDTRLRSFIINGLKPLGADPTDIAAELIRINEAARRRTARARQKTDEILFDPVTSTRRALIFALGIFGSDGRSPGEQEPLIEKLLELYRSDPDAGIHGATEWTLRTWGQGDRLKGIDTDLRSLQDRGERRWYLNKQGQTFAVIDGPVKFQMGSPATEPERTAGSESPRQMSIPRSFAIATKEVTFGQFQKFLKDHDQYKKQEQSYLRKNTSAPDGPWISADWYAAAAYCNWLSEQEGIPKEQWCYEFNDSGAAEGMRVPVDALKRTGYRLSTDAEWEYACRAGAVTSRYYGLSTKLLGHYAWSLDQELAHPGGALMPNDLGLFDMLGNVYEWCQDRDPAIRPSRAGVYSDLLVTTEIVSNRADRVLRGGMFYSQPSDLRSAARSTDAPKLESTYVGFRLARTMKPRP